MKTLLCLFLSFFTLFLYSQNTKIIFNVQLNDYSDISSDAINEHFRTTEYAKDYVTFELLFNSQEMLFYADKGKNLSDEEFENLLLLCDMNGSYYKNKNKDFIYRIVPENKFIKNVACVSKIITDWKLSNETKLIAGYECKRADCVLIIDEGDESLISKYPVTAWYSPEIKSSFGPKYFGGLPGLILEVSQNLVTFGATKVESFTDKFPVQIPLEWKIVNEKDFFSYYQKLKDR
jgi:GLPGLI family protein